MSETKYNSATGKIEDTQAFHTRVIPEQAQSQVAPNTGSNSLVDSTATLDPLAQYQIRGKIGSGGMGIVYVALDQRLGRFVAIKRLKPELLGDVTVRRRFLQEAKAAAALNNVHIVHIYSIGEDEDGPYLVMEYVESSLPRTRTDFPALPQTLEQSVESTGPLKLDEAVSLILKIGHAIEQAHQGGVIHRDLKPSNILLDGANEPKIVDFGLARLTHQEAATNLTVSGDKFISLGYGAPEQESDAKLTDERADIYGMGALLYFTLTGKNPRYFREEDIAHSVRPLVCKALAMDRDVRYQTMASFNAALVSLVAELKTAKPTVKTTWRCKWCDTVNPLSTRFCAECGWDGREQCLECGENQQVGTMFCGVCGANTREYEATATVMRKMRNALEAKQYEWIITSSAQPLTFEPVGPSGRKLLDTIQEYVALATKRQQRREQLREMVGVDFANENFERAERFIHEFREISSTPNAFEQELSEIPAKTQKRDLARIQKAFMTQDWDAGDRLLHSIHIVDNAGDTERKHLMTILRRHRRRIAFCRALLTCLTILLIYLSIMPSMIRLNVPATRYVWHPVHWAHRISFVGRGIDWYASLWGVTDVPEYFRTGTPPVETETASSEQALPPELEALQSTFESQMKIVADDLHELEERWMGEYIQALEDLRSDFQEAGNLDAWKVIEAELNRFDVTRALLVDDEGLSPLFAQLVTDSRALRDKRLAVVYRKQVTLTREFITDLDSKVKELTRLGSMEQAEHFNRVLKIIEVDEPYLQAESFLVNYNAQKSVVSVPNLTGLSSTQELTEIIQKPKSKYETVCSQEGERYSHSLAEWESGYLLALSELSEQRQQAGDWMGLQIAEAEKSYFELTRIISDPGTTSGSVELDGVRTSYTQKRAALDDEYAWAIVRATDAYSQALFNLATQLTKEGKIDKASFAMAERQQLELRQEVIDSRNRVAETRE